MATVRPRARDFIIAQVGVRAEVPIVAQVGAEATVLTARKTRLRARKFSWV